MQAKDIPEQGIIDFLQSLKGKWATHWQGYANSIPCDAPEKVLLAKLRAMIRKGLIYGCACGCRGDFRLEP